MRVFELFGSAPHSPTWSSGALQRYPPPEGFELFFANAAKDRFVVPNSEAKWLQQLGARRLRERDGCAACEGKSHLGCN